MPRTRHRRPRLDPLEDRTAPALVAQMLKDINTDTNNSIDSGRFQSDWAAVGGTVYFPADDAYGFGAELWKTDGTAAGTSLVKDIIPGVGGSDPYNLTAAGSKVFFVANDGLGWDLWASDGWAAGTVKLTGFQAGRYNGFITAAPRNLYAVGNTLYFAGFGDGTFGSGGWQLWKSDGTVSGTVQVATIGTQGSALFHNPYFAAVGGTLYFAADDGTHGNELWKSDGTAAGTTLVADVTPGSVSSYPWQMTAVGSTLYFSTGSTPEEGAELWKTDGTAAGTVMVADLYQGGRSSSPEKLTAAGGLVYFTATDGTNGYQVWRSDGTAAGTFMLRVDRAIEPDNLIAVGDTLFFTQSGDLFKSDGTTAGTVAVADLFALGAGSSTISDPTVVGTTLYFAHRTTAAGTELWESDGTAAGTGIVADVWPGAPGSGPRHLTAAGGRLLFAADDRAHGYEPWVTDGTAAGTRLVADVNPHTGPSNETAHFFTPVNGTILFFAYDGAHGMELWRTDGTGPGTALVTDINPGLAWGVDPQYGRPVVMDGYLYFSADDGVHGRELWRSDGTAAGTAMVYDAQPANFAPTYAGLWPRGLTVVGHTLYFQGGQATPDAAEPWASDGTAAGTIELKDIFPGFNGSYPTGFTAFGGYVFFAAKSPDTGTELWRTDGTPAGTVQMADINPGYAGSSPADLTVFNNRLFFAADSGSTGAGTGRELWATDGTPAGTALFKDIHPGTGSAFEAGGLNRFTPAGSVMYFAADDGTRGRDLWKTDGSAAGTVLVADIPGPGLFTPIEGVLGEMTAVGGTVYFAADDGTHGAELWKSDGTAAGTVLVKDIFPEGFSLYPDSSPTLITPFAGEVYFTADDYDHGRELWRTDGTAAGTVMVADIFATPGVGSDPLLPTPIGGTLYFSADDGDQSLEPWTLTVVPPAPTIGPVSPDPRDTPVASVPFVFNTPVTGFDLADLSLTRDGDPVSLSGATLTTTDNTTFTLGNIGALTSAEGTYVLRLAAAGSGIRDADRVPMLADATATWVMDTTPPAVTAVAPVSPDPRNTPVDSVAVTFSEPIDTSTVTAADLTLTRDGNPVNLGGLTVTPVSGSTYRFSGLSAATAAEGAYQLTVSGAGITDLAGNFGGGSASAGWVTDTTPPTVAGVAPVTPDPRNTAVDTVDVTFSEPIAAATFDPADVALTRDGSAVAVNGLTITPLSATAYRVGGLAPYTVADGAYQLTIDAAGVQDPAGNAGTGTAAVGWTMDATPPKVTVEQAAGQADPTNGAVRFDVVFSEPVLGFDETKVDLSAGTAGGPLSAAVVQTGPAAYRVTVTRMSGSGTVVLDVPAGEVTDPAGNPNLASTSADNTVTYDADAPAVTVNRAAGQPDPTITPIVQFDVAFDEPVVGFDEAKVDLTGTTAPGATAAVTDLGDHTHFAVTVSGMTAGGAVVAAVDAGAVVDLAGNPNLGSTTDGNTVTYVRAGTVQFAAPTYSIARLGGPVLSVVVRRVGGSDGPLSVDYATADGSAVAGTDYTAEAGTLSWADGDAADRTIEIPVTDPGAPGPDGTFTVALANASPAGTLGSPAAATVTLRGAAGLALDAGAIPAEEGNSVTVTVHRVGGAAGAVSVDYTTAGGSATAPADYAATSGTLSWGDGDTADKTFSVPIRTDGLSEGRETFRVSLGNPTGGARLGTSTEPVVIAPSDGTTVVGVAAGPVSHFTDADGDLVTIGLGGKQGTLTYYLTNGSGPIAEIDLAGTDPAKSTVTIAVKKPKGGHGDGRVQLGEVGGSGFKSFSAKGADVIGAGFNLTGFAGSITVGNVSNGADFELAGAVPTSKSVTKITAGVIGDGTDINVAAPLGGLTAVAVGKGTIEAPLVGAIKVTGLKANAKKGVAGNPGDFDSNVTVSGLGADPIKGKALGSLSVAGAVNNVTLSVGGNVGSVSVGAFNTSDLFVGYTGPVDGSGTFGANPFGITSFTTKAAAHSFVDSYVIASAIKAVTLASVDTVNAGKKFGFDFRTTTRAGKPFGGVGKLGAKDASGNKLSYNTKAGGTQLLKDDFEVKKL